MDGIPFGTGIQFLFDGQQRFTRAALPVYLRVRNFQDEGDYLEVGVPYAPTGTQSFYTGYTDVKIEPPPSVQDVSLHNIGLLAGRLNFGSRVFIVSNTFVERQMREYRIADPYDVFRDRTDAEDGTQYKVIGLIYNSRQFAIESLTHKEVAGKTINWKLIGNALETVSDSLGQGT
jgi:hypothetical protein